MTDHPAAAPTGPVHLRPLLARDQAALWDWLHIALWDPPPAGPRPRAVLDAPGVRIYAEDWGRPGDLGVVAVVDGRDAGACWMRCIAGGQGLAHVDAATPQLGIALVATHRGRGLGALLMRAALDAAWAQGHRQVALTVHPQNPAARMYARCGFEHRGLRNTYHLMVATRPGGPP